MNEIAGTLYYVLANDHNSEWADHAEEDTYFLFHALMMDIRDVFVPDMDSHSTGIQGRIENMQRLLQTHDPDVHEHLQACGIDSHFFAYRWLTTLLSREFLLPDTIRLWDSMFASTHKENFLRYVCVTMVMYVRDDLLMGDFSSNLRLLQRYPPTNVDAILESSRSLWMYEAQVGAVCQRDGITWQEAVPKVKPPSGLIMAYGFKGGIATNLQFRLENATEGLLGRAQRLWSGWSKETDAATPTQAIVQTTTLETPQDTSSTLSSSSSFEPPPRSRFWNRSRRGTNDSEDNVALVDASDPSTPVSTKNTQENLTTTPREHEGSQNGVSTKNDASSSVPRRRIWNQSPSAPRTPDSSTPNDIYMPEAAPLPTLQVSSSSASTPLTSTSTNGTPRRFLWNRGWSDEATAST